MKYLGVDWGLKRIGLAISEGELADPFGSLEIKSLKDGLAKLRKITAKEGSDLVVIGKPEGEMGEVVEKVTSELKKSGLKVETADETLSTQEAKKELLELGKSKKARREDNALAAAIILQRYLDEKH